MKSRKCSKCTASAVPGKGRCRKHAKSGVEISRARRQRLKKLGLCIDCRRKTRGPSRCRSCLDLAGVSAKRYGLKLKLEVLNAYGGPSCVCCGEDNLTMLTIDHTDQDGAADRRAGRGRSGQKLYHRLRRLRFPPGYRVLCRNCNYAVFFSPGNECPHRLGVFSSSGP